MGGPNKHYRAFISYSHQDKVWGKRIHTWLETYRVPVGTMVDFLPRRLGRFFRDDEEMAAAADIAGIVSRAIDDADNLIVICSPRSAQSKWVNAEVQHFRRTGRSRKVFAVIVDGFPNSGHPETECFPPALRAAGDPDHPDALPIEPLGLDVRQDGHEKACARLAAGLLGVDFDDLWQRDRRRAERRQHLIIAGLAGVSLVFAALAATAGWFGVQAERNAVQARQNAAAAQANARETEAARQQLQREYLGMLGETAISEAMAKTNIPGEIITMDPAWISLMSHDDQDFAVARSYQAGRVLAVAHDGVLNGLKSERSQGFLRRSVQWLTGPVGEHTILIARGHCEWLPTRAPDWTLPSRLSKWGYVVNDLSGPIDQPALAGAGVLIVGNAWGDLSDAEIDAVEQFVAAGGGLLVAGLGWSWQQDSRGQGLDCTGKAQRQAVDDMATYPMNRLVKPYRMRWTEATIAK